jgi:hypothetical protein
MKFYNGQECLPINIADAKKSSALEFIVKGRRSL